MKQETVVIILESLMAETARRFSDSEKALKIRNWTVKLENITDEQGMNGLDKALEMPMEFMPSIGTFKEMCIAGKGSESLESDAWQAWGLINKNINAYSHPVFKDSCISEAIRQLGGWFYVCGGDVKDESFKRKDFINIYQILRRRNETYNPRLKGNHGSSDKFIGYDSTEEIQEAKLMLENWQKTESKIAKMLTGKKS